MNANFDFSRLTISQLNDLISRAAGELASRASGKTIAAVDQTIGAATALPPANKSADHMARMRQAKAAKKAAKQGLSATDAAKVERASARVLDAQLKRLRAVGSVGPMVLDQKTPSFKVRKPTGKLCMKRFSTAAECQAWVASWCKPARLSSYSVVSGA